MDGSTGSHNPGDRIQRGRVPRKGLLDFVHLGEFESKLKSGEVQIKSRLMDKAIGRNLILQSVEQFHPEHGKSSIVISLHLNSQLVS
jgi:hypothetical protein